MCIIQKNGLCPLWMCSLFQPAKEITSTIYKKCFVLEYYFPWQVIQKHLYWVWITTLFPLDVVGVQENPSYVQLLLMYYVAIREVPVTSTFSKENTGPEQMVQPVMFWPYHFLLGVHPLLVNVAFVTKCSGYNH